MPKLSKIIVLTNASYAHTILTLLKKEGLVQNGDKVLTLLQYARRVNDDYMDAFYEFISPIVPLLFKYAQLEEACTKSSHYRKEQASVIERIEAFINGIESDENEDVYRHFYGML